MHSANSSWYSLKEAASLAAASLSLSPLSPHATVSVSNPVAAAAANQRRRRTRRISVRISSAPVLFVVARGFPARSPGPAQRLLSARMERRIGSSHDAYVRLGADT